MEFISAQALNDLFKKDSNIQLIDVREPYECTFCSIGIKNIPMDEIPVRWKELNAQKPVYLVCKSGNRAQAVANLLTTEYHFEHAIVLEGGITAYMNLTNPSYEMY